MTAEEIKEMMEGFKFAAGVAMDASYDAVEIHAHAGCEGIHISFHRTLCDFLI